MKYCHKYNEQPWKLRRNIVAIATKIFDKSKTYDADVVCATKNHGKLRRIPMEIATTTLIHQDQSYDEDVVCAMNIYTLMHNIYTLMHDFLYIENIYTLMHN